MIDNVTEAYFCKLSTYFSSVLMKDLVLSCRTGCASSFFRQSILYMAMLSLH